MGIPYSSLHHPLVIAHRGSMTLGPENTLYSFELAKAAGADVLELDVHPSLDGQVMVIHDDTVDRTSNGQGLVRAHTLKELKKLDFAWHFALPESEGYPMRGRGVGIPTLAEVLDRFPEASFSIDVKEDDTAFAQEVVRLIRKKDARDRLVLGSFHPDIVELLRNTNPKPWIAADRPQAVRLLAASLLGTHASERLLADAYMLPDRVGPLPVGLQSGLIRRVHALGRRIYVWTVDNPKEMKTLLTRGADGIITNRTDLAFAVRRDLTGE